MGGESLKGPLPARGRLLGLHGSLHSSLLPPPHWAVLASGSLEGQDFSRTPGCAHSPWAFLLPSPLSLPTPAEWRCHPLCPRWGRVGAPGAGSGTVESEPLPEVAWGRAVPRDAGSFSGAALARSPSQFQLASPGCVHLEVPEPRRHPLFSGRGVGRYHYFELVQCEDCKFEDSFPG